jgi:hypothetical protein
MKQISIEQLQANHFYWARRRQSAGAPIGEAPELEVIRISTIFGSAPEFWTVAMSGSEEHFDLEAFEYLQGPLPAFGRGQPPEFDGHLREFSRHRALILLRSCPVPEFKTSIASFTLH